ncbi:MAG: radical SAM family heme chaperone HemW [Beijerinckiaceae bacterium]
MNAIRNVLKPQPKPAPAETAFGVYVHWPFCLAKCPYCDFNSHVRRDAPDQTRYVEAFRREIAHRAALTPGRRVGSIFFGGGTPSLMAPGTVAGILDAIAGAWSVEPDAEITLEANPTSVEAERFRGYRAAGVNRLSIGVQALHDADLKALGRMHSVAEALTAVKTAAAIFERYSFDLIYARSPDQTPEAWRAELETAISHAAEHLSLYQLTIEPDTAFAALHKAGKLKIPDEERGRALWDVTQDVTEKYGMPAYEISNHARPGAESRHNLVYWRYQEYAGIGPGAHGRLLSDGFRRAQATAKSPEAWMAAVEADGHGLVEDMALSAEEQGDELLLMGLRLREGIDLSRYAAIAGRKIDPKRVGFLIEDGLVEKVANDRLRVTPGGFPVLDAIVADLAA